MLACAASLSVTSSSEARSVAITGTESTARLYETTDWQICPSPPDVFVLAATATCCAFALAPIRLDSALASMPPPSSTGTAPAESSERSTGLGYGIEVRDWGTGLGGRGACREAASYEVVPCWAGGPKVPQSPWTATW